MRPPTASRSESSWSARPAETTSCSRWRLSSRRRQPDARLDLALSRRPGRPHLEVRGEPRRRSDLDVRRPPVPACARRDGRGRHLPEPGGIRGLRGGAVPRAAGPVRHPRPRAGRRLPGARRVRRRSASGLAWEGVRAVGRWSTWYRVAGSVAAVALVTGAIELAKPYVPVLSLGVLYILAVLPVAIAFGLVYAVSVAVG